MSIDPSEQSNQDKRRGLVDASTEPRFLVIGRVTKAHGVNGEVRVVPHTELPERFTWLDALYVGEKNPRRVGVESVRFHQNLVLLKLTGYDDRDTAETLRGEWLQVPVEEGLPLEEGEYYLYQLIGLNVVSDAGEVLGQLSDVIETGANNVFVVSGTAGELLLPDIDEIVLNIDFEAGQMTVHLLPGLR